MGRLFGTDGVRGIAGTELTAELAQGLGRAAVHVLGGEPGGPTLFVVGRDPRSSGVWLEEALVEGITGAGGDVLLAGVEPTPAIAFHGVDLRASASIVISASHNPAEHNGIKFFDRDGYKLPDQKEDAIEETVGHPGGSAAVPGTARPVDRGARDRYLAHLEGATEAPLHGMTVVVDCANGAASDIAPELYRRLGATVHAIHARPDGRNINDGCGALHPEVVAAEVVRLGADAGISHDGDADRALFADSGGEIVDGDQVLAACALSMHEQGRLPAETVVTTVMANLGFARAMRDAGIRVMTTKVGDRYVVEEMLRTGAELGGEQSGHIVFLERATTGDGLLTAVRFLSLAARRGLPVSELAACMRRYPQVLLNVPAPDPAALADAFAVEEAVRAAEAQLGDAGRVLVRASGTEPLIRVMVEAESEGVARTHAEALASAVRAALD
jgi:phosphoglucosamine mutase